MLTEILLCGAFLGGTIACTYWGDKQLAMIIGGIVGVVLSIFLLAAGCALIIGVLTDELTVMLARVAPLLLFSTASLLTFLFGAFLKEVKQHFFRK